jgi:hypothetical protein
MWVSSDAHEKVRSVLRWVFVRMSKTFGCTLQGRCRPDAVGQERGGGRSF